MTRLRWLAAVLLAFTLVAAGCGGDDGGESSDADRDEPATEEAEADEPEGQVLVDEDFDDDNYLWSPEDLVYEDEQDAYIEDGAFTVEFLSDAYEDLPEDQALVPNQAWPTAIDGAIDEMVDTRVDGEVTLEVPGVAGLACRIADVAPDATDYRAYFFQISSTGQVNLAKVTEEGDFDAVTVIPELDEDEEPDEIPLPGAVFEPEDGASYDLSMSCVDGEDGVELSGSIDGEEVISGVDDDDPIDSGQAGLIASQSRLATELEGFEPFEISVDSITITNLGDEIDEDLLEEGPAEAEEPAEPEEQAEPEAPTDDLASSLLGVPVDPTTIAEYGTNPDFDLLATDCFAGTFDSCDALYRQTPVGSSHEAYGASCGGRLDVGIDGNCAEAAAFASHPGSTAAEDLAEFGTDPALDDLALSCEAGDLEDCDQLYLDTPLGSEMEAFGSTCGARDTVEYDGSCIGD
jgi:hypothetical protein